MKHIVLLGDSIRMSYQNLLRQNLQMRAEVWSPEENSEDSAFILKHLETWLAGKNPDLIVFNCGLHDIFLNPEGNCRRTIAAYEENLVEIFRQLRQRCPQAKVVFVLTTPVDEERQKTSAVYDRVVRRGGGEVSTAGGKRILFFADE